MSSLISILVLTHVTVPMSSHVSVLVLTHVSCFLPGRTVGYPAHPRLIRPSVRQSVRHITFNFSADNGPGPTDLVKYCLKIVN
jgi:hypothetical protein